MRFKKNTSASCGNSKQMCLKWKCIKHNHIQTNMIMLLQIHLLINKYVERNVNLLHEVIAYDKN